MRTSQYLIPSLILALIVSCSPIQETPRNELVDIGTHKLFISCVGSGQPTIILDTGIGETFESWASIIQTLSVETRVCAYHRAGYGKSEIGPMPRDSQREADELHQLLVGAKENVSIVLVGHSLGALNMQVYADTYPENVKGLVLIDPPPLAWMQGEEFPELRELFIDEMLALREAADMASASNDPEMQASADFLQTLTSENEEFFEQTVDRVSKVQSFGKIPVIVIGATEPEPGFGEFAIAYRQFWNEESKALAEKSNTGEFLLANESSHHIHLDSPELVITAIIGMIE
jgi:pimeloyl-ACP methyl ester carboxylesterase